MFNVTFQILKKLRVCLTNRKAGNITLDVFDNLSNSGYDVLLNNNDYRFIFQINTNSMKTLFLRCLITYKKAILLLAIFLLLIPGFLPHGFINSNKAVVNNLASHAELCCCGKVASTCSDCCCSDDHAKNDNTDRNTVTITACGGAPDYIITISKLNYLSSLSAFVQYISVTTMAETATPQFNGVLRRQPYKPPKPQLLSNLT